MIIYWAIVIILFGAMMYVAGSLLLWLRDRRVTLRMELRDIADNGRLRQGNHYTAVLKKGEWVWIGWGPGW